MSSSKPYSCLRFSFKCDHTSKHEWVCVCMSVCVCVCVCMSVRVRAQAAGQLGVRPCTNKAHAVVLREANKQHKADRVRTSAYSCTCRCVRRSQVTRKHHKVDATLSWQIPKHSAKTRLYCLHHSLEFVLQASFDQI